MPAGNEFRGAVQPAADLKSLDTLSEHAMLMPGRVMCLQQLRVELLTAQARKDAAAGTPLNTTAADRLQAKLAFDFQVATTKYPTAPVGDPLAVSKAMRAKS